MCGIYTFSPLYSVPSDSVHAFNNNVTRDWQHSLYSSFISCVDNNSIVF
uniref:Uncharacterized protein n=1 Tax=Rhizophora mucronata TaxID=61149 RepID=A0A2P2PD67_RHIMU